MNKSIKKNLLIITAVLFVMVLVACSQSNADNNAKVEPKQNEITANETQKEEESSEVTTEKETAAKLETYSIAEKESETESESEKDPLDYKALDTYILDCNINEYGIWKTNTSEFYTCIDISDASSEDMSELVTVLYYTDYKRRVDDSITHWEKDIDPEYTNAIRSNLSIEEGHSIDSYVSSNKDDEEQRLTLLKDDGLIVTEGHGDSGLRFYCNENANTEPIKEYGRYITQGVNYGQWEPDDEEIKPEYTEDGKKIGKITAVYIPDAPTIQDTNTVNPLDEANE